MRRRRYKRSSDDGTPKTPSREGVNYQTHLTYDEYIDLAVNQQPKEGSASQGDNRSSRATGYDYSASWSGTDNWSESVKLVEEGWPKGRDKMADIVAELDRKTAGSVVLPMPVLAVCGDYVDIGAFLTGQPENMVRWEDVEVTKRVARILYNMSVSAGVSTSAIEWRGATLLALIDRLEAQGIRVELDAVIACQSYSNCTDEMYFNLKKASDPLYIDRLAFHLVNASAFRRIGFSAMENREALVVNSMGYHNHSNYGCPRKVTGKGYDLLVPEMSLDSIEGAIREIEKMFNTICEVEKVTIDPEEM